MAPDTTAPDAPFGVPLTDVATLARRLRVAPSTVHSWVQKGVPWLPAPQRLAGRWVWLTSELEGVEERAAERPRRGNPAWTTGASTGVDPAVGVDPTA